MALPFATTERGYSSALYAREAPSSWSSARPRGSAAPERLADAALAWARVGCILSMRGASQVGSHRGLPRLSMRAIRPNVGLVARDSSHLSAGPVSRNPTRARATRPNPSLHLTSYSGLRPPPAAGELQRYAAALPHTIAASVCGSRASCSRARSHEQAPVRHGVARARGAAPVAGSESARFRTHLCLPAPGGGAPLKNGALRHHAVAVRCLHPGSRPGSQLSTSTVVPSGLARHNPSLHLTAYSGLRPPPAAGELQR